MNHHHFQEVLEEREGVTLSPSSVWRILTEAGIASPRRRRPSQHRGRRERYPQEGMVLQVDGSRHDWLEGRGSYLSLVGAIDDATGTVPYALFREQEDTQGYFLLLREVISRKGVPWPSTVTATASSRSTPGREPAWRNNWRESVSPPSWAEG